MEITLSVIKFKSPENIKKFTIRVNDSNYLIVKRKLKLERKRIVDYLKKLCKQGIIKSERRPKNSQIQDTLDDLTIAKRVIKSSIEKINLIF